MTRHIIHPLITHRIHKAPLPKHNGRWIPVEAIEASKVERKEREEKRKKEMAA